MSVLNFLAGIYFASFAFSGIFFLKFYLHSKDRFFLFFCSACWLLAIERIFHLVANEDYNAISMGEADVHSAVYLCRLGAFLIILFAIMDKNRKTR